LRNTDTDLNAVLLDFQQVALRSDNFRLSSLGRRILERQKQVENIVSCPLQKFLPEAENLLTRHIGYMHYDAVKGISRQFACVTCPITMETTLEQYKCEFQ